MLQFLRNNTKIVIWFTILLLVGVFGLSSISLRKHDQYAGEAFGKKISFQEFRIFETMTRLMPPSPKILEEPGMANRFSWQQLMLSREAKNQNIQVSDEEVRARVGILLNSNTGKTVSPEEYLSLLKGWRTTPNEFESGIREMIRIQKLLSNRFTTSLDAADFKKDSASQKTEEQKRQQEYIQWISSLYLRAKMVDYSIQAQKQVDPDQI